MRKHAAGSLAVFMLLTCAFVALCLGGFAVAEEPAASVQPVAAASGDLAGQGGLEPAVPETPGAPATPGPTEPADDPSALVGDLSAPVGDLVVPSDPSAPTGGPTEPADPATPPAGPAEPAEVPAKPGDPSSPAPEPAGDPSVPESPVSDPVDPDAPAGQPADGAPVPLTAAEALSFVYVGSSPVEMGAAQPVAFFLANAPAPVSSATLEAALPGGARASFGASACTAAAAGFSVPTESLGYGLVEFVALDVAFADGSTQRVVFASDDMWYGFVVAEPVASYAGSGPELGVSFYTTDASGSVVEAYDLEDALGDGALAAAEDGAKIVVALDAGHDSSRHHGAVSDQIREEELTLKIAQYAKAELETYPGIEVYMVRDSGDCPYPNAANEGDELRMRVEGAVAAGAQVFVSIHLNSFDRDTAHGAEVWYPNKSVNELLADAGASLSEEILDELVALGLYDRGTKQNGSLTETGYDYYSVIRNSKLNGIAGIIVEHAFISNGDDYEFLMSEDNLRALGVADATGIANYFGLTKDGGDVPLVTGGYLEVVNIDIEAGTFDVVARHVSCNYGVGAVVACVSTVEDEPVTKWYDMVPQADGTWTLSLTNVDFGGFEGDYLFEGYLRDADWDAHRFSKLTVEIAPEDDTLLTAEFDADESALYVEVSLGKIPLAKNVAFAATGKQGGTKWYQAEKLESGAWCAYIPRSVHGAGDCVVEAWATVGDATTMVAQIEGEFPAVSPVAVDVAYEASRSSLYVVASGGAVPEAKNVAFAVTSAQGGTKWYQPTRLAAGSWYAFIPRDDHGEGACTVEVWATASNGLTTMLKSAAAEFPKAAPLELVTEFDASTGRLYVEAKGGKVPEAKNVAFAVVSSFGTLWYQAEKLDSGSWRAYVPRSAHGAGTHGVQLWATVDGSTSLLKSATVQIPDPGRIAVTAQFSEANGTLDLEVSGGIIPEAKNVAFAVTGTRGGTQWYQPTRLSTGAWSASIPRANHGEGACTIQVWVTHNNSTTHAANATGAFPQRGAVTVSSTYNGATASLYVAASNGVIPEAKNVAFAVWGPQSGTMWYQAERLIDGSWCASVPRADHAVGPCTVEVWATVGASTTLVGSAEGAFLEDAPEPENPGGTVPPVEPEGPEGGEPTDPENPGGSEGGDPEGGEGGSDPDPEQPGDSEDPEGEDPTPSKPKPGDPDYVVTAGTAMVALNADSSSFVLIAQGGSFADSWNVAFAVTDGATGQIDWYAATRSSDGSWRKSFPVSSVSGAQFEVYAWASVGDEAHCLGSVTFSTTLHPIVAADVEVSVEQLVAAYKRSGATYPEVFAEKGAATIEDFCAIVIDEAKAEGIDPRAVFAQAMLETGYLRFGGDVKAEQCNFCGLGATGGGVAGATFETVALGIRAQVQHLKAYASTEPLVNECVDPRFHLVSRGIAPYLESLGGRWAVSYSYGFGLSKIVDSL